MPNWIEIFRSGALERCGKHCGSLKELAAAISKEIDSFVNAGALDAAFRRHRVRLNLKPFLMEYMGVALTGKPAKVKPEDIRFPLSDKRRKALKKAKKFVITAALNNSAIDGKLWEALKTYAAEHKAEILVLPVRYKNPTSRVDGKIIDADAWWPSEVKPYMVDDLIVLHEKFWVMGHVRVQATAIAPLSSFGALSKRASAVFGHGQLAMQMVPVPQSKQPKVLYTTGSVSQPNYSDTRAGILGDFHHGKGGIVVELDGPRFHVRALVADDDGGFYDVDRYYTAKKSEPSTGALALVTGDEHAIWADPKCKAATYQGSSSIVKATQPAAIVRHDVFDGYSISHHHDNSPVTQIAKHHQGLHKVEHELQLTIDHIDETTPPGTVNLIVWSNHNDHLLRWMKEKTPLDEPWNAEVWTKLWALLMPTIKIGEGGAEHGDPLALWCAPRLKREAIFLEPDSDETIGGIAVGLHGHRGSNGARGSLNQFAKLGVKTIVGHSHTPGIRHGAYQVGTSSYKRLEYTGGPSSWAHCHCLIHPNGKRQLIFVIDGHWRA